MANVKRPHKVSSRTASITARHVWEWVSLHSSSSWWLMQISCSLLVWRLALTMFYVICFVLLHVSCTSLEMRFSPSDQIHVLHVHFPAYPKTCPPEPNAILRTLPVPSLSELIYTVFFFIHVCFVFLSLCFSPQGLNIPLDHEWLDMTGRQRGWWVKNIGWRPRPPRSGGWLHHLSAVCPWISY